jgi:hypothetical protein
MLAPKVATVVVVVVIIIVVINHQLMTPYS